MKKTVKKSTKKVVKPIKSSSRKIRHTVEATMSNVDLVKAGSALTLKLYVDQKVIGTLKVGRGSFIWTGAKKKKTYWMNWTDFAKEMDRLAYGE